jgi:hypothetical protein
MPRDARLTAKHAAKFIAPAACHQKTYPVLYRHRSCNAAVETFVNTMKAELLWHNPGRRVATLRWPFSHTSMASTIRDDGF